MKFIVGTQFPLRNDNVFKTLTGGGGGKEKNTFDIETKIFVENSREETFYKNVFYSSIIENFRYYLGIRSLNTFNDGR